MSELDWHTPEFERRFWIKVAKTDGCWLWEASKTRDGYGKIWTSQPERRALGAHRASWMMAHGKEPADGLVIDHLCRVPACVNPAHLEAVPHAVNVTRDTPTHCVHGHPLDGVRRKRDSDGSIRTASFCKVCDKGRRVSRRAARERGAQRERAVKAILESQDYLVTKSGGSLGAADLVALRAGSRSLLVQVKSDEFHPYAHFRPQARAELRLAAKIAGATPVLAWWPPRGKLVWLEESAWPS